MSKSLVSASDGHSCSQRSNSNSPSADYRLAFHSRPLGCFPSPHALQSPSASSIPNCGSLPSVFRGSSRLEAVLHVGISGGHLTLQISQPFLLSFTAAFGGLDAIRPLGQFYISGDRRKHKLLQQINMPRRSSCSIEVPCVHLLHPSCFMSMVWRSVQHGRKETCEHCKTTAALLH